MFPPFLVRFFQEEDGQTLVEYGLLISLIALAIITAVTVFGRKMSNHYNAANNQIPNY